MEVGNHQKFVCNLCSSKYNTKTSLIRHIKWKHSKNTMKGKNFKCHMCEKQFIFRKSLLMHLRTRHLQQSSFLAWQLNLKSIRENKSNKCHMCEKSFNFRKSLSRHLKMRHPHQSTSRKVSSEGPIIKKTKFKCQMCEKQFVYGKSFLSHLRMIHDQQSPSLVQHRHHNPVTKKNNLKPSIRKKQSMLFRTKHLQQSLFLARQLNLKYVLKNKKFKCQICDKKFNFKRSFSRHLRMRHSQQSGSLSQQLNKESVVDKNNFQCQMCAKEFVAKSSLCRHFREKHPEQASSLTQQLKSHFVVKREEFNCQICDKKFNFKRTFSRHLRKMHSEQLPSLSQQLNKDSVIKKKNFQCPVCAKEFVVKSSMVRHIRQKHPEQASLLIQQRNPVETKKDFNCQMCEKQFTFRTSLLKHLRRKHFQKSSRDPPIISTVKFNCNECNSVFNCKSTLKVHLKKHSLNRCRVTNQFSCNVCVYSTNTIDELIKHYHTVHEIQIRREVLRFSDVKGFLIWKEREEVSTYSKYVKHSGAKRNKNGSQRVIYFCHRQGSFKSKTNRLRNLKIQGSNKTVNECPSRLMVTIESSGEVVVDFIMSHVGHDLDIRHLNLTSTERKMLATRIAMRIPFQEILDEVRNSVDDVGVKRYDLITRKDLQNIMRCFKLNSNREMKQKKKKVIITNQNDDVMSGDAVSMNSWTSESEVHTKQDYVELLPSDFRGSLLPTTADDKLAPKKQTQENMIFDFPENHLPIPIAPTNGNAISHFPANQSHIVSTTENLMCNYAVHQPPVVSIVENLASSFTVNQPVEVSRSQSFMSNFAVNQSPVVTTTENNHNFLAAKQHFLAEFIETVNNSVNTPQDLSLVKQCVSSIVQILFASQNRT